MKIISFKKEPLKGKNEVIELLLDLVEKVKNDEVKAVSIGAYFDTLENPYTAAISYQESAHSASLTLSLAAILNKLAQDKVLYLHDFGADYYPPSPKQ